MPLLCYLQLGDTPTAATIEACYVTCIFYSLMDDSFEICTFKLHCFHSFLVRFVNVSCG